MTKNLYADPTKQDTHGASSHINVQHDMTLGDRTHLKVIVKLTNYILEWQSPKALSPKAGLERQGIHIHY